MNTETRMRETWNALEQAFTADLQTAAGAVTRSRRRRRLAVPALAGGASLAAAGVVIALALGGGRASSTVGGSDGVAPGGASAVDTAYIVTRVKAKVAATTPSQFIVRSIEYDSGTVGANGSLTVGPKSLVERTYRASDGSAYMHQVWLGNNNTVRFTISDAYTPNGSRLTDDTQTVVNPSQHTYSKATYRHVSGPNTGKSTLGVTSTAAEVKNALQTGRVHRSGMTTIDGRPVIVLTVEDLSHTSNLRVTLTLYVDAQTYQPLRDAETQTLAGTPPDLWVDDWEPVTQSNIAAVEDASVPAGYKKVSKSHAIR